MPMYFYWIYTNIYSNFTYDIIMVTALTTSQFNIITYTFYEHIYTNHTCQVSEFLYQNFTLHSGSTWFQLKILAGHQ